VVEQNLAGHPVLGESQRFQRQVGHELQPPKELGGQESKRAKESKHMTARISKSGDNPLQPGRIEVVQPKPVGIAQPIANPASISPQEIQVYIKRCFQNERRRIEDAVRAAEKQGRIQKATADLMVSIVQSPLNDDELFKW